jgi:hypothetical protein
MLEGKKWPCAASGRGTAEDNSKGWVGDGMS